MYPSIIIDEHEFNTNGSLGYAFYNFIEENKIKRKDHFEIKLKGDHYILFKSVNILNLNNVGDIVCGNTVIEIKNENYSNDYTISMQSGHLDQQLDDMFEREEFENSTLKYKYVFVLGEMKDNDFYFTKLQAKHIVGRCFESEEHLIYWILYTLFYNNSAITPHISFEVPHYNPVWTFLKNVPGVGRKRAESIVKNLYHITTLEDLMNLSVAELTTVNGIGKATANLIIDYIHNERPYETLLDELNNPELRKEVWDSI